MAYRDKTILAILQARMSSTRLPGKVLMPILSKPMLAYQIERVQRSKHVDRVVLATSREDSDTPIADFCRTQGIACFRGSLHDVLDRFYQCAKVYAPDVIVRLTGDCPLADPGVIDLAITAFLDGYYDYLSNTREPSWPHGLDVEVVWFAGLERAWREATAQPEREHVMPFFYNHPEQFRIGQVVNHTDLSDIRWTVDYPQDFAVVRAVFEHLYPSNPDFTTDDVLRLMQTNPETFSANKEIRTRPARAEGHVSLQ